MTPQQREKAIIIRDDIKAKIDKDEPAHPLNSWCQPCGNYGCVAGDTVIAMYPECSGDCDAVMYGANRLSSNFEHHFGFEPTFFVGNKLCGAFSSEDYGTLQQRLDYVESQLALNEHGS